MIHPIAAKTGTEAWLRAVNLLAGTTDRIAYNVILDIEQPITVTALDQRIVDAVDRFLEKRKRIRGRPSPPRSFPLPITGGMASKASSKTFPKRRIQS